LFVIISKNENDGAGIDGAYLNEVIPLAVVTPSNDQRIPLQQTTNQCGHFRHRQGLVVGAIGHSRRLGVVLLIAHFLSDNTLCTRGGHRECSADALVQEQSHLNPQRSSVVCF
jgi:hypothetical protein